MRDRKRDHCDTVDADPQKILDAIRAMNIVHAQQTHRRQHPNAITGAKISAVHR